jgi:hypothetical protein
MITYFEIGGEIISSDTPNMAIQSTEVRHEQSAVEIRQKPKPGDPNFIGPVDRSKVRRVGSDDLYYVGSPSADYHYRYSIGVGRGHPLSYLASYAAVRTLGMLTNQSWWPKPPHEDQTLY